MSVTEQIKISLPQWNNSIAHSKIIFKHSKRDLRFTLKSDYRNLAVKSTQN